MSIFVQNSAKNYRNRRTQSQSCCFLDWLSSFLSQGLQRIVWYLNWLLNTSKADGFTQKIDDIIPKYSPSINRFQLLTIQLFFIQHLVFWSLLQPNLVVTLILNSLFLHGIASICNNLRHPSQGITEHWTLLLFVFVSIPRIYYTKQSSSIQFLLRVYTCLTFKCLFPY